jgi:hypothetical protein
MPGKVLLGAWLRCGSREHGFDRSYLRRSHLPGTLENMYGSCDLWIDSLFLRVGIEANSSNKSVVLESTLVFQAKLGWPFQCLVVGSVTKRFGAQGIFGVGGAPAKWPDRKNLKRGCE